MTFYDKNDLRASIRALAALDGDARTLDALALSLNVGPGSGVGWIRERADVEGALRSLAGMGGDERTLRAFAARWGVQG